MNQGATTPTPAAPLLQVQGLAKHFTLHLRQGLQLPVLADLSFDLAPGECLALVGASGRGKSTLLKCLYGSYAASAGSMRLQPVAGAEPIDLAQAGPQQWLDLRRCEIAYVSQFLRVVPRVATLDIVAERLLLADAAPGRDEPARQAAARSRAAALLARLNLPEPLWSLPPATFSGGEQQRVNIARGFVLPARLLLLDEPTASLDAANRRVVITLIHEALAAGSAVIGVFHDEEVRDAVATRCLAFNPSSTGVPA